MAIKEIIKHLEGRVFCEYKPKYNSRSSKIKETDKTIDKMEYELCGSTEEVIEVVEKNHFSK